MTSSGPTAGGSGGGERGSPESDLELIPRKRWPLSGAQDAPAGSARSVAAEESRPFELWWYVMWRCWRWRAESWIRHRHLTVEREPEEHAVRRRRHELLDRFRNICGPGTASAVLAISRGAAMIAAVGACATLAAVFVRTVRLLRQRDSFARAAVLAWRRYSAALVVPLVRLNRRARRARPSPLPRVKPAPLTFTERLEAEPRGSFCPCWPTTAGGVGRAEPERWPVMAHGRLSGACGGASRAGLAGPCRRASSATVLRSVGRRAREGIRLLRPAGGAWRPTVRRRATRSSPAG